MKKIVILSSLAFLAGLPLAHAGNSQCLPSEATCHFEVDNGADDTTLFSNDANPGDGICKSGSELCTLRAAVEEANALKKPTTITLGETALLLGESQGELSLVNGAQVTITGQGADKTSIITENHRAFSIDGSQTQLTLEGIAFSAAYSQPFTDVGGAIKSVGASLHIKNCVLSDFRSVVRAVLENGNVVIKGLAEGGAISTADGDNLIEDSYFDSNWAYVDPDVSHLPNDKQAEAIDKLKAKFVYGGGAIFLRRGNLTILRSSFYKNKSANYSDNAQGGAIYLYNQSDINKSVVHVVNSTFSENVGIEGDAIYSLSKAGTIVVSIANSTFVGGGFGDILYSRDYSTIRIKNSVVARGTISPVLAKVCSINANAKIISGGYNLLTYLQGCNMETLPTDLIGTAQLPVSPLLAALSKYDATHYFHPVYTGGFEIDGGDPAGCSDFSDPPQPILEDQLGFPRSTTGRCDIGAVQDSCGDGFKQAVYEECDDGNFINGDGCDSNCSFPRCGNGVVGKGETCDDGNDEGEDGCSSTCQIEESTGNNDTTSSSTTSGDTGGVSESGGCSLHASEQAAPVLGLAFLLALTMLVPLVIARGSNKLGRQDHSYASHDEK